MDSNIEEALRKFALQKMQAIEKEKQRNPNCTGDNAAANISTGSTVVSTVQEEVSEQDHRKTTDNIREQDVTERLQCIDDMDPKEKKAMFSAIIQNRIVKEMKEGLNKIKQLDQNKLKKAESLAADVDKDVEMRKDNGKGQIQEKKAIQIKIFSKDLSEPNAEKTKTLDNDGKREDNLSASSSEEEKTEAQLLLPWRELAEEGELTASSLSEIDTQLCTNVEIEKLDDKLGEKNSKRDSKKKKKHKHKHKHKKSKHKKSKTKSKEKTKDNNREEKYANERRKYKSADEGFDKQGVWEWSDKKNNVDNDKINREELEENNDSRSKAIDVEKEMKDLNEIAENMLENLDTKVQTDEKEHKRTSDEDKMINYPTSLNEVGIKEMVTNNNKKSTKENSQELLDNEIGTNIENDLEEVCQGVTQDKVVAGDSSLKDNPAKDVNASPIQESDITKTVQYTTEETQPADKNITKDQKQDADQQQMETENDGKDSSHSKAKKRKRDKGETKEGESTEKHKKRSRDEDRKRKDNRRSRSRSRTRSRRHRRSSSRSPSHRSQTSDRYKRHSRSRSRDRSSYKTKTSRMYSDRRSRSPAERIDKAKLLEIAKANAYAQMKAGLLPASLKLPPLTNEDKASQRAGGQTITELTAVCQAIQKKGQGVDSGEESPVNKPVDSDEDSETFINHPFKLKPQIQSIVVNIKNAVQRPNMDKDKLRIQFPVSSGSQHRKKEDDVSPYGAWVPYQKPTAQPAAQPAAAPATKTTTSDTSTIATPTATTTASTEMPTMAAGGQISFPVNQATSVPVLSQATSALMTPMVQTVMPTPAPLPPPVPVVDPKDRVFEETPSLPAVDIASMVSARLKAARALESNPHDVEALGLLHKAQRGIQSWANVSNKPGQFTGSTGVQVLNPKELANSNPRAQAWAKKDMFLKSVPVRSGIGMMMLQRMGWRQGEGLGKNKEGAREPILLEIKSDRKGLVSADESSKGKPPATKVVTHDLTSKHPVSALMEICNKRKWRPPLFELIHDSGPSHQKNFVFKVIINNEEYQPTTASGNKKHAKAQAATVALQRMGLVPMDYVLGDG